MSNDEQIPNHKTHTDGKQPVGGDSKGRPVPEAADSERIKELRDRLYSRGDAPLRETRHALPRHIPAVKPETPTIPVSTAQNPLQREGSVDIRPLHTPNTAAVPPLSAENGDAVQYSDPMASRKIRSSYRKKFLILGGLFFIAAISLSSIFMFMGKNTISGQNISIGVTGPISVGGGEEISFQVSVANQNTIPIESATLIIEYPKGTHSATEVNKEIGIVRMPLDTIGTGELVNVPLKARMFGEENEEKEIKVSIDYRVAGSNATFQKVAAPLRFKMSNSPVVMSFDAMKTISSGQELELKLTVQSNSPSPLSDLLVKVTYPDGFDFTDTDPDTVSGEDTWKFTTLKPGEKKVITIKGLMTGYENEVRKFTAAAGVANASDRNTLASMLAKAEMDIFIEKSFLDVSVTVNGSSNQTVVMSGKDLADVEIRYKNALDTVIYDGEILVELGGNALDEFRVDAEGGYYDSSKDTIRWDGSDERSLKEILPGETSSVRFTLDPDNNVGQAPEMTLKVTVRGERVFEDNAPQELTGVAERTIKIESVHVLTAGAYHESGPFRNTGPTPPVAEEVTQYTFTLTVETGANDVTGAEVTGVIPQYVSWLDLVTDGDDVTYNPSTRTMRWIIGDMDANSTAQVSMQVSFLPSISQVGKTPTLLEVQRFKATDRFTGTVVRAEHPALTTSLQKEDDEELHDGKVRAN
jgi:hypothetical protein